MRRGECQGNPIPFYAERPYLLEGQNGITVEGGESFQSLAEGQDGVS